MKAWQQEQEAGGLHLEPQAWSRENELGIAQSFEASKPVWSDAVLQQGQAPKPTQTVPPNRSQYSNIPADGYILTQTTTSLLGPPWAHRPIIMQNTFNPTS